MYGPELLARTLSVPSRGASRSGYADGREWQYNSRSDRHSKVAAWGLVFDLMSSCSLLKQHIIDGKVGIGINHELRDFRNNKKKNLDLVIAQTGGASNAGGSRTGARGSNSFADLASVYGIHLSRDEQRQLDSLPPCPLATVSTVLVAVEAKAAMTAFAKAMPRLKDELTGSHNTVHGDHDHAIAAGIVMINAATTFVSPDRNRFPKDTKPDVVSNHKQPQNAELVINGLRELQRRSKVGDVGFDALGVVVIDCTNDGRPVSLVTAHPPAPLTTDDFDYGRFVRRTAQLYASRFSGV